MSPNERLTQSVSILCVGGQNRKWFLLTGNNQCLHVPQQGHTENCIGQIPGIDLTTQECNVNRCHTHSCLLLARVDIPQCTKRDVCYLFINVAMWMWNLIDCQVIWLLSLQVWNEVLVWLPFGHVISSPTIYQTEETLHVCLYTMEQWLNHSHRGRLNQSWKKPPKIKLAWHLTHSKSVLSHQWSSKTTIKDTLAVVRWRWTGKRT